jgi:lysophospholipase L1-like esterase
MIEATPRSGYSGKTLADIVSTYLYPDMAQQYFNPDFILLNIGANDVAALPAQATWEANLATCLDAWHTKWPKAHIYITRPWRQTYDAQCNLLAGYIDNVIATRTTFAHLGVDERVFLKGSDNGATYTSDGIHPNHLGHMLAANEWRKLLNV